jgi:uncharacterized protein with NAD-binding domain and iron-sulfur cluster
MKQRIAVLGGGMGSLVAAFELTNQPGWKDRWDLTVYQEGWRLGGKGASGRNPDLHQRIEEHGLHILFGFYENAFRVMRECYRELGRHPDAPLSTIEKAFTPGDLIVMMENVEGKWIPWPLDAPRNDKTPGVGPAALDPSDYVEMLLRWSVERVEEWLGLDPIDCAVADRAVVAKAPPSSLREAVRKLVKEEGRPSLFDLVVDAVGDAVAQVTGGIAREISEFLYVDLAHRLASGKQPGDLDLVVWLSRKFSAFLWSRPIPTARTDARRLRMMIDFTLAVVRGMIVDRLIEPPHDFHSIDDVDLRTWLRKHGAHEDTLASPMLQGLYDAAFSTLAPSAAGTSLHGFLRMALTYKGSILYRMNAGMGDTIFAPLYEVLRRRGVKFEFFHSVERIENAGDRVERIHVRRQATPKGVYRPLVDVDGLPCWPSRPLFDQLVEGEALRESAEDLEDWWTRWPGAACDREIVLERGRDFDQVILGISIGAFPYVARDLIAASPPFAAMVENVKTTQTQCFQLWITTDLKGLGWSGQPPIVIPYAEPFDTWADMTHLLSRETWPTPVGHCAYMCSSMEDDGDPFPPRSAHGHAQKQNERCKENAIRWMREHAGTLWPYAAETDDPRAFNWSWLVDEQDRDGVARFDAQYWRAPMGPSERYVLAVPGSTKYRLRADESGFGNLWLAGDWTRTAMSVGCLEGATMGGIQAARAIDPRVPKAVGDWLPDRSRTPALAATPPVSLERPLPGRPPSTTRPLSTRVTAIRHGGELPRYIETDGNQIAAPPIKIGVDVRMFLLDADYASLRAICDTQLNLPGSPVTYRPLGPFVVLYCSNVDNYPLVDPIGWVPEKDFGIWMPVVAGRTEGPLFVAERILTYTPYIWVDNGVALIGGRTVFGFAKQIGAMTLPQDPKARAEYALETLVVPRYAPDSMAVQRRLLSVKRRDEGIFGELRDAWRTGENVIDAFRDKLSIAIQGGSGELPVPSIALARELIENVGRGMRMVFLKQFPDALDGSKACYQAIVEADVPITSQVEGGYLRGDWEVEVHRYDSHRLVEGLGLKPRETLGDVARCESIVQGWAKFEAVVQPGRVVYEAS